MRVTLGRRARALLASSFVALLALLGATVSVFAAPAAGERTSERTTQRDTERVSERTSERASVLRRASDAVIGVQAQAIVDAPSNEALGRSRRGSGVVIGPDDLVLTIGYLILEADQVQVVTDDGRVLPSRVVAYDVATGFGLVQPLVPLRIEPAPLGQAASISPDEPLMVASGGEGGTLSLARMVSRRAYAGYWEYHIEGALFTTPPRPDHSGAGLFNARGELMGIGSLLVMNALGPQSPQLPGNMFVPIDLLRPILAELRTHGRSAASRRAWLGLHCSEQEGRVLVVRVSADSPAAHAGLRQGDRIVRIDGVEVSGLAGLWKALWSGGRPERDVVLDIERDAVSRQLTLQSVDRMSVLRKAQGI